MTLEGLPIARWKGYGGETDFHGSTLETITWAVGATHPAVGDRLGRRPAGFLLARLGPMRQRLAT
jgi:hypothetical protein